MSAGTWAFTDTGKTKLLNGTLDIGTASIKLALFTSASNLGPTSDLFSNLTGEVSNTGYTGGGKVATLSLSGTATVKVDMAAVAPWTAGTTDLVAKWAVLYEAGGSILCYCTLDSGGANVTATIGNTLTITVDAAGIFTLV